MAKWIKAQEVETEDLDLLETEIKNKLRAEQIKRNNKQEAKHWRNGREQYNDQRSY